MVNWKMYGKIQEQKRKGLNKSQVSRNLEIDYKTVLKYWDMTADDYAKTKEFAESRSKKADKYKDCVLEYLRKYPDMSSAQLFDRIKEENNIECLDFKERAFRNFVSNLRTEYGIPKKTQARQYEAVDERDMGFQAQVDMGEVSVELESGRHKKIYCFVMIMSCSRMKYVLWQEKPFTTESFVSAHISAFSFFGGRPKQMVYDQDKILAVSENHGDIIYTQGFQNYVSEVKFDIFLCHGDDPESKGMVENAVKYAKHGFADHRIFKDIDSFNQDCISWLKRTGNAKVHGTTKKIPAEVFKLEKEYLIPVSNYSFETATSTSIRYKVRKDNIVNYKGNRYRVPKGTYCAGKEVEVIVTVNNEALIISDSVTGEIYAEHPLCHEKGKLIGKRRDERDKSKSLKELEENIKSLFENDISAISFLENIHKEKPRYYRDQLGVIKKLFEEWECEIILKGLEYCINHSLYSAGELKSSIMYLNEINSKSDEVKLSSGLPDKYHGDTIQIRDLSEYDRIMGGVA